MRRRPVIAPLAILSLALGTIGCDRGRPTPATHPFAVTIVDDAPGSRVEIAGVRIDFDAPVVHQTIPLATRTRTESLGDARVRKTVETVEQHHFNVAGDWLRLDGGHLRWGAHDYGPVVAGDRVRVGVGDGAIAIAVNGEPRARR